MIRYSSIYQKLQQSAWGKRYLTKKGILIEYKDLENFLSVAPPLYCNSKLRNLPKVGIVKDGMDYKGYVWKLASWVFYERFLKNNNIPYGFYDIFSHDWLSKAKDFDIIVWRVNSTPSEKYIAESKIYILEKVLDKLCFPSFHEVWQYEDKNRGAFLYEAFKIPNIPTLVSNSKNDSLNIMRGHEYPFVSKTFTGSGSSGVEKINSVKHCKRKINNVFGYSGKKTPYPYFYQKDSFLFQKYIDDATYDLRIMMIGDKAIGYYRYPNKGDFRASGADNVEKKEIPIEAIKLALVVKDKLKSRLLGVDLLYSTKEKKYFVIESSLFNQIDSAEEGAIDGIPGYYDTSVNEIEFKKGRIWIHELVMQLVIDEWTKK